MQEGIIDTWCSLSGFQLRPPSVERHIPPEMAAARMIFSLRGSIHTLRVLPPTLLGPSSMTVSMGFSLDLRLKLAFRASYLAHCERRKDGISPWASFFSSNHCLKYPGLRPFLILAGSRLWVFSRRENPAKVTKGKRI